jgi:hypothetical protein
MLRYRQQQGGIRRGLVDQGRNNPPQLMGVIGQKVPIHRRVVRFHYLSPASNPAVPRAAPAPAKATSPSPFSVSLFQALTNCSLLFHLVAKVIGLPTAITVIRHTEKLDLVVTPEELRRAHQRN